MSVLASAPPQVVLWFFLAIAVLFYVAPAILGIWRGVSDGVYLLLLNVTLGWTVVGWVIALIWACRPVERISLPEQIDKMRAKKPAETNVDWLKDTVN